MNIEVKIQFADNGFIVYYYVLEEKVLSGDISIPTNVGRIAPVKDNKVKVWSRRTEIFHNIEDVINIIKKVNSMIKEMK